MDVHDPRAAALERDPFASLELKFGFLPNLFRAQVTLPHAVSAEVGIADAVVLDEGALGRRIKEILLLVVASTRRNVYCTTAHAQVLTMLGESPAVIERLAQGRAPEGLTTQQRAMLRFALLLGTKPHRIQSLEIERLRQAGLSDEAILEGILTVSLGRFLCTLSEGLGPAPDFAPIVPRGGFEDVPPEGDGQAGARSANSLEEAAAHSGAENAKGPYLREAAAHGGIASAKGPYLGEAASPGGALPAFDFFREKFGFVPNLFRAQSLRPDVIAAEVEAIRAILLAEDLLSRRMKEFILLAISARNLNTYCVAVHCEMLRGLGVDAEISDQIAVEHRAASLPPREVALLDMVVKLQAEPEAFGPEDLERACGHGWSESQVVEAIVMAALSNFLNTLQSGLGPTPDFAPRLTFAPEADERVNPRAGWLHPTGAGSARHGAPSVDPDEAAAKRAREGDLGAFEELVVKHHARVYRVLLGLTASPEEAEDGTQEVFLKALQKIETFRGAARFSTWLTRIAINEGLERLRSRKPLQPLAEEDSLEAEVRPANLAPWMDDPEEQFSRQERRRLVERGILELPLHYRSAVLLRDVAQLSTAAAAEAMGLGVPTFKTRLLRGRLLLREALAPHFARPAGAGKEHA